MEDGGWREDGRRRTPPGPGKMMMDPSGVTGRRSMAQVSLNREVQRCSAGGKCRANLRAQVGR